MTIGGEGAACEDGAATLREAGFAPDLMDRIDHGIRAGLIRGLHGLVLTRHGRIVAERYDAGEDAAWGRPLGRVRHSPDTLHDLRSVTKSIVALLYGIALERGLVPPPDAPLLAALPRYADLSADPARAAITVGHALTMTLGTDWNESIPYTDPANSEIAMEAAPDRIRYVLDRPMIAAPGQRWVYNGGTSAVLGALIEAGSGEDLDTFARQALFVPLGIEGFEWHRGRDGRPSAASGLRLTARDLARIGQLVLDGGRHAGRPIVPAAWLAAMVQPHLATGDGLHYGYQWWLGEGRTGEAGSPVRPWSAGFGNGGQRLMLLADAGLALVLFFGNYDRPDRWAHPARLWSEIVLSCLVGDDTVGRN